MLQFEDTAKSYRTGKGTVQALAGLSFSIAEGEFVAVRGPSGCGKTTLLLCAGGMLRPTAGRVLLNGKDLYRLSEYERNRLRARAVGFVFQMFHLIPYLNVLDNVRLSVTGRAGRDAAMDELERLGLAGRAAHRPAELSAGEKQRVALARAIVHKPKLLLADEPTGNLDPENSAAVFRGLSAYHQGGGTVVVVTHGPDADAFATRALCLRGGRLES